VWPADSKPSTNEAKSVTFAVGVSVGDGLSVPVGLSEASSEGPVQTANTIVAAARVTSPVLRVITNRSCLRLIACDARPRSGAASIEHAIIPLLSLCLRA